MARASRLPLLGLAFAAACACAQESAPDVAADSGVSANIMDPERLFDGYLFWHQADELKMDIENSALLMDAEGRVVHRWANDLSGGGHTSYLLPTGGLLRMGVRDRSYVKAHPVAATDIIQITDRAGTAIWELRASEIDLNGNKVTFHHDLLPLANGNFLVLIYEEISSADARAAGWFASGDKPAWSDGVLEIKPDLDEGGFELVWEWRFIDHIIQDVNENAANFGKVAAHPERIDANFPKSYAPMKRVRQHTNSIDYHPELNQILISAFIYNEIWILDRSTTTEQASGSTGGRSGKGGDLLFRYGNPAAHRAGSVEDRVFSKQHDANWIDAGLPGAGNILVMNNNTQLPQGFAAGGFETMADEQRSLRGVSNVHELRVATDTAGSYGAVETVWFWEDPEFFAPFQGGARRLPNGNTLISNTVGQLVIEVAPDKSTVARYEGSTPTFKSFKFDKQAVETLLEQ